MLVKENKKYIIIALLIILLFPLYLLMDFLIVSYNIKGECEKGTTFLSQNNLNVHLLGYNNYFIIGSSKKELNLQFQTYAKEYCDTSYINRALVYYDLDSGKILARGKNGEIVYQIELNNVFIPKAFSISPDNKFLAFSCYLDPHYTVSAVAVYSFETKKMIFFCKAATSQAVSISWIHDQKGLMFLRENRICKLRFTDSAIVEITKGCSFSYFDNGDIGFYRTTGQKKVFYTMNLTTKKLNKIYETNMCFIGLDWDNTGNYLVLAVPTYPKKLSLLFQHGISPFIYDIKNKTLYRLPYCQVYSGDIWITRKACPTDQKGCE